MNSILLSALLVWMTSSLTYAQTETAQPPEDSAPKMAMDYDKYQTGGIVSTLFGFGAGHAIQQRYADDGWIFTAGEMAAGSVVLASLVPCRKDLMEHRNNYSRSRFDKCEQTPLIIGYLTFSGLRIWEIADAWLTPNPALKKRLFSAQAHRQDPPITMSIIPGPQGASALNLVYRF